MSIKVESCPICGWDARVIDIPNRDASRFECETCGNFVMVGSLIINIKSPDSEPDERRLLSYLSAHTRQANQQGIVSELHTRNWKELAQTHVGTPVSQKLNKLMALLRDRSAYPGSRVDILRSDYPLIDAVSPAEVNFLFDYLDGMEYVRSERDRDQVTAAVLTVKGWQQLEPPTGAGIPGRCFVAMSFDPSLNDAYENGIYLAVKNSGFDPIRIDRVHHNEKICDKIIAEIRLCQFMVADFTLQRAGVYFEAGFAMGLGRPVIWTCRKDDFDNTHFDTRQYNHVVWASTDDLKEKLIDRVKATIPR